MNALSLIKQATLVVALSLCGIASAVARDEDELVQTQPRTGTFSALSANTAFSESIQFRTIAGTTGFSGSIQTTWTGGLSNVPSSFSATLTGPSGFSQAFTRTTVPITRVIAGQTIVIGGISLLRATDATLPIGNYTLAIAGLPKQNSSVSYSLSVAAPLLPAPEPATYAMMLAGLGMVGLLSYRRRRPND